MLILNAHHETVLFKLPEVGGGSEWLSLIDTAAPERSDPPTMHSGQHYEVTGRSLLLFALKPHHRTWRTLQALAEMTQREAQATTGSAVPPA